MSNALLLWMLGICNAAFCTAVGARLIDRAKPNWPFPGRLILASLSTPLVWIIGQVLILAIILPEPRVHAGFVQKWPSYLREVLLGIGLKLWVCGLLCAAVLTYFRFRSSDRSPTTARGQLGLLRLSGACAAAIVFPIAMDVWINTGQINGRFEFWVLFCAFSAGLLPVLLAEFAVMRAGRMRWLEPVIALYALLIAWRGFVWHSAVASRPGSSAVTAVEICALAGVFLGWLALRHDIRAAAASRDQS